MPAFGGRFSGFFKKEQRGSFPDDPENMPVQASSRGQQVTFDDIPSEEEIISYLNNYVRTIAGPEIFRAIFIKKVADENVILPTGDIYVYVETLENSQAAIYLPASIQINEDAPFDSWQTAGIINASSTLAAGVNASILKRRTTNSPDTIDVYLVLSNSYAPIHVSYQVWRVAGLS